MDISEIFKILRITSPVTILSIIVLGFFGRKWIEKYFNSILEKEKVELESKNKDYQSILDGKLEEEKASFEAKNIMYQNTLDEKLQNNQSKLEKLEIEFHTKFNTRHQKTMDVIEETYTDLYCFSNLLKSMIINGKTNQKINNAQMFEDLNIQLFDLDKAFFQRKIYLEKVTARKIEKIILNFTDILQESDVLNYSSDNNMKTISLQNEQLQKLKKIETYLNRDLPKIFVDLEKNFRKLMQ